MVEPTESNGLSVAANRAGNILYHLPIRLVIHNQPHVGQRAGLEPIDLL
ncbi:hypothetical protein [Guyparkeria sp.]